MKIIYTYNVSLSRAQIRVVELIVQLYVYVSCALKYHRDERDRHSRTVPSKRGISRSALRGGARSRLCQSPIYVAHFLANTFISDERRKCHSRRCNATFSIVPRRKYDRLARCHALTKTSLYVLIRDIQTSPNRSRIHFHNPRPDNIR